MNCPYCRRTISGRTGYAETHNFMRHLGRCHRNPANIVLSDGRKVAVTPTRKQGLMEALEIRAASGQ